MEPVKLKIRERYGQMSRSEKKISQVVLTDSRGCLGLTTAEIAVRSGVSAATVTRYVQKLGYDGLEAFKLALAAASAQEGEDMENVVDPIIQKEDDLDTLCRKMNVLISDTFQDFFYQLDKEALAAAIERIRSARHIYLLGIGASMLPAYDLFHKLRRAGFPAEFYQDTDMVVEFFNYVDERDLVIAFSYSGQTQEVLYACQIAVQQKAKVIAVTRKWDSVLRDLADICLFVPNKEAVIRIGAFGSLHTSLMMGDLLYMGAIQKNLDQIEAELIRTRKLVAGKKIKK